MRHWGEFWGRVTRMRSGTRTASSGLCPRISSQTQSGTLRRWAPSTRKTSGVPPLHHHPVQQDGGDAVQGRAVHLHGPRRRQLPVAHPAPASRRNTSGLPGARTTIPSPEGRQGRAF